jgi:phage-related protein (TIGR01555 family)
MRKNRPGIRTKAGRFRKGVSGNPAGRPPRTQQRTDSWENVVTNIGTARDPRRGARPRADIVPAATVRSLWRSNDLAARVIETHAAEALRRGFELNLGEGKKEEADEIESALEEIPGPSWVGNGLVPIFIKALQYEAAYGGAAIWPVMTGAQGELDTELNENAITSIERLALFEPRQLRPAYYYDDPLHPKHGEPAIYEVLPLATRGGITSSTRAYIHETRLIIFPGIRVSQEDQPGTDPGWGDNKLSRVYQVLADFDLSFGGAAALLAKFSQVVFKLKGLATTQATNPEFKAHLEAMNYAGSVLNSWVVDSEDDVSRLAVTMAGLPDTLDKLMLRLAAAADMPVSLLMGQAPAGLNATGESDIRFFYDRVEQLRERLRPLIERLIKWCLLAGDGPTAGNEPDTWCVEFPPLWEPSKKEEIETRKTQAEIDKIYIEAGVQSPEETAQARFGGDTYSFETQIDFAAREAQTMVVAPTVTPEPEPTPGAPNPDDQPKREARTGEAEE